MGDALLTLTGGAAGLRAEGALEITGVATGTKAVFPTGVATAQLLQPFASTNAYVRIFTGVTGLEFSDQSLNPLLQVEDDETKSYSRLISVTRAAAGGVVGAVLKNTAGTGVARLQLDANGSTGLVWLEAASAGGCTLDAPNQEIWLQNPGAAPLVVETDSDVTVELWVQQPPKQRSRRTLGTQTLASCWPSLTLQRPKGTTGWMSRTRIVLAF